MNLRTILSAVKILRNGGVVAHPTDTCYGLAVDIFNEAAVERLYEVKGMTKEKPVSILVRNLAEAQKYGVFSEKALELAARFWPGTLTLVVPRTEKVPLFLNPEQGTIGLRVIDEMLSIALLEGLGGPVTTTSANWHKKPSPYSIAEISVEADLVLDGGELDRNKKPSTIVRVRGDKVEVLRDGLVHL